MKTVRLFVLVLLAMLLPLRAVSAAALLCEQRPVSHTESVVAMHGQDTAATPGHDHAGRDDSGHDHSHSGLDKGRHCVSACSAAPLMATVPTVLAPCLGGTTVFPHVTAPATTFQSDGQDRPPRSI